MITIGVTGHRILSELHIIKGSIKKAIENLKSKIGEQPVTLLTSLAEGSDRLVTGEILCFNESRIVAVLPFPPNVYLDDFESEESRKEFSNYLAAVDEIITMPAFSERDAAYEAAGVYVVDHADFLICIWDGMEAQGRGGTAFLVERARNKEMPLVWIHAGNRKPGTLEPTSLGSEQGTITYENF